MSPKVLSLWGGIEAGTEEVEEEEEEEEEVVVVVEEEKEEEHEVVAEEEEEQEIGLGDEESIFESDCALLNGTITEMRKAFESKKFESINVSKKD
tara:strand:- start:709 stop:993 length:285 start_codon:yes stop_codon:yes gene_type:complete